MTKRKSIPLRNRRRAPALHIGVTVEAVKAARAGVEAILAKKHLDAPVLIQALKTFEELCAVKNVAVSNCNFSSK